MVNEVIFVNDISGIQNSSSRLQFDNINNSQYGNDLEGISIIPSCGKSMSFTVIISCRLFWPIRMDVSWGQREMENSPVFLYCLDLNACLPMVMEWRYGNSVSIKWDVRCRQLLPIWMNCSDLHWFHCVGLTIDCLQLSLSRITWVVEIGNANDCIVEVK